IRYAAGLSNSSGTLPPAKARVINMSFGGYSFSQSLADACKAAHDAGVLLVAAAGNSGSPDPLYPAANPGVISVMATNFLKERAPYSNTGNTVDIAAPGGDSYDDANGDGYGDGI